jgi:protein-tyrosine phosphatase
MDCSPITDTLYLGTTPEKPEDYNQLRSLGITLVINMRIEQRPNPDPHNQPLRTLHFRTIDHPFFPIPIHILNKGTRAALDEFACGGKVFVHCFGGRHRSVAMAASILIAQGRTPDEAMNLLKERHDKADPYIWYIRSRIMRFAKRWENINS